MKVLSLFDGISCGMVALERIGAKIDTYYSSEIENVFCKKEYRFEMDKQRQNKCSQVCQGLQNTEKGN